MEMERHPLSAAWGDMPEAEFGALVEDVRQRGVIEPVSIFDGKVLDGWHRYRAAKAAGKKAPLREMAPTLEWPELISWVAAKNAHRRHMTKMERAAAVQRCFEIPARGRPGEKRVHDEPFSHGPEDSTTSEKNRPPASDNYQNSGGGGVANADLRPSAKRVAEIAGPDVSVQTVKRARRKMRAENPNARTDALFGPPRKPGRTPARPVGAGRTSARPVGPDGARAADSELQGLRREVRELRARCERLALEANSARRAKVAAEGRLRGANQTIKGLNRELAAARGEMFEG